MLAILLYVAADFANPLMPGAVCFDPDESVDGVGRPRASAVSTPALTTPAGPVVSLPPPPPPPAAAHGPMFADARAAGPAPRARTALPLLSDRSADDA